MYEDGIKEMDKETNSAEEGHLQLEPECPTPCVDEAKAYFGWLDAWKSDEMETSEEIMEEKLLTAIENLRTILDLPETFEPYRVVETAAEILREYSRYRNCPRDIEDRD